MVLNACRQFFVKYGIEPCRLVLAVSGGADSTALLLALADLRDDGFELVCAHINHHLRGAESDADEAFVGELCATLDIPVHVANGALDENAVRAGGVEAAARDVRYARLQEIRERTGARFVATAHQKNDQAETVLMRLLTGSGIAGLRGIHPVRDDGFVRPLLNVTRDAVDVFLRERNVTPRFDRSNDDRRFLRNRIRAVLSELGGAENLAAVAEQARMLWPIVERAVDAVEDVRTSRDATHFRSWPEDPWLRQALLHRHIRRLDPDARDVSAADLARLAAELEAIRRVSVTKSLELVRRGDTLTLRKQPEATDAFELELTSEAPAWIPELDRTVKVAPLTLPSPRQAGRGWSGGRQLIQLPADSPSPLFTVRNRRPGDRFHPLGLVGSKRLKDFLIDRKIEAELRDRLPLLIWNEEIVWIAGVEVSERFKVTSPPGGSIFEVWLEGSGVDDRDQAGLQR